MYNNNNIYALFIYLYVYYCNMYNNDLEYVVIKNCAASSVLTINLSYLTRDHIIIKNLSDLNDVIG